MTILAFFGAGAVEAPASVDLSPLPDQIPGGERIAPYSIDFNTGPYRAPVAAVIPTYDGGNQTVHPSVVDMVATTGQPFRGFRYWMAHTPYQDSNVTLENPSISVSNNGWEWQDPKGVSNPIFGPPTTGGFYGDTDLVWNPDAQEFFVSWVWLSGNAQLTATSKDGVNWTERGRIGGFGSSPTIVRKSAGDWWMMKGDETGVGSVPTTTVYRATTPTGPWQEIGPVVIPKPDGDTSAIWHYSMRWDASTQRFHWLGVSRRWVGFPAVSVDGMRWRSGSALSGASMFYHPTFTPDGDYYNVWATRDQWEVQYMRLPRSIWDNIPDPT